MSGSAAAMASTRPRCSSGSAAICGTAASAAASCSGEAGGDWPLSRK
ncbi:hypothetical protein [Streptomyces sp. NPDC057854]